MKTVNSQLPSDKKFGSLFTFVFALVGYYNLREGNFVISQVFFVLSALFFLIILIKSEFLRPLNRIWMEIGSVMGCIMSPLVMGVIFFGIFTPIAFLMRVIGRNELKLKDKYAQSFWIPKEDNKVQDPFKHQF